MQALLTNRMKRKLALVFALIVLALLGVSVRLAYINKTSGDKYTKKVLAQQDTNSTTLPYRRGDILDRNGTILATSEKVYNLILDPKVLWQNQDKEDAEKDCVEPTIKALVQYFELDESELRATLSEKKDSSYVILRKQLSKDEIADFKAAQEDKETGSNIKGVWFEDSYIRRYPYNSLACHVIGYTVTGNQGQTGIEEEYSDTLNGINGRSYKYLNEDLEQSTSVKKAVEVLKNSLDDMIDLLNPGGRICVITFHSLEDRIVKTIFKTNENPCTCPSNFPVCVCGKKPKGRSPIRKPITPGAEELEYNKRSKSAKLRVFERIGSQEA